MLLSELFAAPPRLWTVAEYAAIGETEPGYTELVDGRLVISPSPSPDHQIALQELAWQLNSQIPDGYTLILDIDIDLQLAPADEPGFSRWPDLIIVDMTGVERVSAEGGILRASDVRLVAEISSLGSRRIDTVDKRSEYADAGIEHYWIIDMDEPASIVACNLAKKHELPATGIFTTEEPFPVTIDLGRLR